MDTVISRQAAAIEPIERDGAHSLLPDVRWLYAQARGVRTFRRFIHRIHIS